jgi:transposase
MDFTANHYAQLLGLQSPWKVTSVDLDVGVLRVDIHVNYESGSGFCPECGKACKLYDQSAKRSWRHLDTMQFATHLHSQSPRIKCEEHGVKTISLPWAAKHSGFTLLFEAFAIRVLQASRSTQAAGDLLGINWHQIQTIMERAVQRGLARREPEEIAWIGMDEKSFRSGHNYISLINDLENSRVLEVVEGREGNAASELITSGLDEKQREMVCGVCIDMSAPYINAIQEHFPHADIIHDKFHISQHLGNAVDKTRRIEHAKLQKQGDESLTKTKYLWLKGMEHLSDEALSRIKELGRCEFEVSKAWYLKELFKHFWNRRDKMYAQRYFEYWEKEVATSGVEEMKKVARMLRKHLANILSYFDSYITNAFSEGINSKIQAIKANARGFRNFKNYRTRILFFCGKLSLAP